jgi:hypothetical protein
MVESCSQHFDFLTKLEWALTMLKVQTDGFVFDDSNVNQSQKLITLSTTEKDTEM